MDAETRRRFEQLEKRFEDLLELVDGWDHPRSHRQRLHMLENNDRGVELAKQLLKERGAESAIWWQRVRDWTALLIAACALLVSTIVAFHSLFA